MDRIDKFLGTRPSKNKRLVRVGNKEVEVTRDDVKKVRRYLNRECLDSIDLCAPLDTRYSRVPCDPVSKPKRDVSLHMQQAKIRQVRRRTADDARRPRKPKEVATWTDFVCDGGPELVVPDAYDQDRLVCEQVFTKEDLDGYYKELEMLHLRPRKEKAKPVAVDRFSVETRYPEREVKVLPVGRSDVFYKGHCLVKKGGGRICGHELVDIRRNVAVDMLCGEDALVGSEGLFCLRDSVVFRRSMFSCEGSAYEVKDGIVAEISPVLGAGGDEVPRPKRATVSVFAVNREVLALGVDSGVFIFDLSTKKTFKFRTPRPDKMELRDRRLFVQVLNALHVFDVAAFKRESVVNCVIQDFSVGRVVVVASGENVIVDGRRMHQRGLVRHVRAHQSLPIFCAVMTDELRVFCYAKDHDRIKVRLCKRIPGRFSSPVFHVANPWIYAYKDGMTRLYA